MINRGVITLTRLTSNFGISNGINNNTHLNLSQDRQENVGSVVTGSVWTDKQERSNGIESRGFDEHRYDGPVQRVNSVCGTHSTSDVAAMDDETGGDHEGEDDVEADGDSEVGKAKVYGDPAPQIRVRLGSDVERNDAHSFGRKRFKYGNTCSSRDILTDRDQVECKGEDQDPTSHIIDHKTTVQLVVLSVRQDIVNARCYLRGDHQPSSLR